MGKSRTTKVAEKKTTSSYHIKAFKAKKVQHEFRTFTRDHLREKATVAMFFVKNVHSLMLLTMGQVPFRGELSKILVVTSCPG